MKLFPEKIKLKCIEITAVFNKSTNFNILNNIPLIIWVTYQELSGKVGLDGDIIIAPVTERELKIERS